MTNVTVEQNIVDQYRPLFDKILAWGEARNLIKGATMQAQFVKLLEEIQEILVAFRTDNLDEYKDGIGDSAVVLTILAGQAGFHPIDCLMYGAEKDKLYMFGDDSHSLITPLYNLIDSVGLLSTGISKKNDDLVKRGIGRALAALDVFTHNQPNFGMLDCIKQAYDAIKDRKGRMVDGVFVKEADLIAMGLAAE